MKKLIATLVLALSCLTSASAETMRAQNDAGEIMLLQDTPCVNETIVSTLRKEVPQVADQFQAGAYISPEGVKSPMCWYLTPGLSVAILHEDGATGSLPVVLFAPVPKAEGI